MSEPVTTIVEAIGNVGRSGGADVVWRSVKACAAANGYTHMLALKGQDALVEGVSGGILYDDMPEGFAAAFDAAGFSRANPLVSHALTERRPYTAAELWAMPLTMRQRRSLARLNRLLGVLDGLIIPIYDGEELEGIVLMGGKAPDMRPVVRSGLHLLAQRAFEQIAELAARPRRRDGSLLSPREVECLRWAAAGKTDIEIGRILSISPRTTRFHVENAKKKLGVATRVQAVAEALRRNAIAA